MASLTDYNSRGLKIVTPEPLSGAGGQALNDNFKAIADKLNFTPANLTLLGDLDLGTNAITNVGNVDGVDISGLSLDSLPTPAAADIACNGQNITGVGTVDGKDVSTLVDAAGAVAAVEAEATLEFDAATVISTATGDLDITLTGTDTLDVDAPIIEIDSADSSNLTMTANAAIEKTLTVKAHNNDNTSNGDSKLLLTATKTGTGATGTVSVAGDLVDIDGSIRFPHRTVSADGNINSTDHIVSTNSSSNTVLLTLPAVSAVGAGLVYIVKDVGGAAATNNITVQRAGSDTIDGGNNVVISANYGSTKLYCDGAAWFTI
jgi:hypothetical protein